MKRLGLALVAATAFALASRPAASASARSSVLRVDLQAAAGSPDTRSLRLHEGPEGLSVALDSSGSFEAQAQAPLRFSAVGLVLHGRFPEGARVEAEVAYSPDGVRFRPWQDLPVDGDLSDAAGGRQAHALLLLPIADGRALRYRLRLSAGAAAPLLSSVDLHFIDSTEGPTEMDLLRERESAAPQVRLLAGSVPKPALLSRAQWGAKTPTGSYSYCQPTTHMGLHHTASQGLSDGDLQECAAHVRAIQAYHMNSNGWIDIGYHYLVCRHGTLFEGRGGGDNVRAAHDGINCDSMGLSAIGYYHAPYNEPVPEPMLGSIVEIFAWKAGQNGIDPQGRSLYRGYGALMDNIFGHRNVKSTACPGNGLYAELPWIRDEVERRLGGLPTDLGNLVGLILEEGTNSRLAGARCSLAPGGALFVTGADGAYRFEDLQAGTTYTVSVTHTGHVAQSKSRTIEAGIDNWNSLWLQRAASATVAVR